MRGEGKKIRVGIITGKKAYPIISEISRKIEGRGVIEINVFPINVSVISLATTEIIRRFIESDRRLTEALRKCDVIIIPGTVKGDAKTIAEAVGAQVYKGGINPSTLPKILEALAEGIPLSTLEPAESVLKLHEEGSLMKTLEEVYGRYEKAFEIGRIAVPLRAPPIMIASETPVTLSPGSLEEHARILEENGSDIVVVGIPLGESLEESTKRIAAVERGLNDAVLGVDSANMKALIEGAKRGAEVLLSLHLGNMEALREVKDKAFVVIPGDPMKGIVPGDAEESASMLAKAVESARKLGFEKIIADPILNPPGIGLSESLAAYRLSAANLKEVPIFAGLSNVVELFDADSPGIVALLVQVLGEIGVSVMLTSEESWKAKGMTFEARIASLMASYSLKANAPPHNCGLDLLLLKEKNPPLSFQLPPEAQVEEISEEPKADLDKDVYFTIGVDVEKGRITVCAHSMDKNLLCLRGTSARALYKSMLRRINNISQEHAAYLGYELSRAELSLLLGKSYVQDEDITFENIKNKKEYASQVYKSLKEMMRHGRSQNI